MTVFFLNATSFGTTIGDLWDISGLSVAYLILFLYNDAAKIFGRKVFCAESWSFWRGKW